MLERTNEPEAQDTNVVVFVRRAEGIEREGMRSQPVIEEPKLSGAPARCWHGASGGLRTRGLPLA